LPSASLHKIFGSLELHPPPLPSGREPTKILKKETENVVFIRKKQAKVM
jgi:hypothetical protein